MTYDAWKTTPPDDRRYCPHCFEELEDAPRFEPDRVLCRACRRISCDGDALTHEQMIREARYDARCDNDRRETL